MEVLGIYSIPEWWQKLEQSGAIDNWYYQVNVGEAKCINGKMNQRELTEEEKNNLENKKKPPPKIDKKNPEAVKAEEDRLKGDYRRARLLSESKNAEGFSLSAFFPYPWRQFSIGHNIPSFVTN